MKMTIKSILIVLSIVCTLNCLQLFSTESKFQLQMKQGPSGKKSLSSPNPKSSDDKASNDTKVSNEKDAAPNNATSTNQSKTDSSGSTNKTEGTNVLAGRPNSTNAAGMVGPIDHAITSRPYKVMRCDQIIMTPIQIIMDHNDYCKKKEAFFTMSIYLVNTFDGKDPKKLTHSIVMGEITDIPSIIGGTTSCVDFRSQRKRISACFGSVEEANEIIQAYYDFLRCRKGENMQDLRLMSMCHGKKEEVGRTSNNNLTITNEKAFESYFGKTDKKDKNDKPTGNADKINPYYGMKVPGMP